MTGAAGPSRRALLAGLAAAGVLAGCTSGDDGTPAPSTSGPGPAPAPSGSGFGAGRPLRLGVNYVPTRRWWYSWADWQQASVADDLASIAALGLDHIRIMVTWPDFQPNPGLVRDEMLARLVTLLDLADDVALDVEVTVFNGAVSGVQFLPPWLLDTSGSRLVVKNFLTDPDVLAAERRLLAALAGAVGSHRRFLGFDLSNEIHWAALPLLGDVAPSDGDAWHRAMFAEAERVAPGRLHVSGIDGYPWQKEAVFSRSGLATAGTATAIHTWPGWTKVIEKFGALSTPSIHYSEYYVEFVKAFHENPARLVWLEETGVSKVWMPVAQHAEWAERTIRNAATCGNLFGLTWWCSHDLNPALTGFVPLEYDLGLLGNDRSVKPLGRRVAALAAEFRKSPPVPVARDTALVLPKGAGSGEEFLVPYMRLVDRGTRPAVVREERAKDRAHLSSRGITRVVTLDEAR